MSEAAFHIAIAEYKCIIFSDGTLVNKGAENPEVFGLNCIFIESGDHKILIDTGCGEMFQSTAGHLVKNLEAEGIKRSEIDRIIFTHGHIDHVGGTVDAQEKPVFLNARYTASEKEWNMFFSPARKYFLPMKDRFDLVKDNVEVLPGIKLIAARGHTPGLVVVDISSGGKRLLCIGDVIHSQREFTDPECLTSFDVTPEEALRTRARILSDAVKSGVFVFACHFTFPGLGYIRHNKGILAWHPI
jgi:glyoxylase-like metal-dependent hydrolase (beta-lactamase superfamily II)